MPTPIDELQAEHRIIDKVLRALDGLRLRLERGEQVESASFEQLFDFLTTFADGLHHQKEEKCLFPALGVLGVPRDRGPIGIMLQEHCTGRALIEHMKRAAAALTNGDTNAARQFSVAARDYVDLLAGHIQKEDNVLFRLAERLLDAPSMQSLQDEFDQADAGFAEARSRYAQSAEEMERAWAL
jgi:hemerythrin-like domain-containing protein